MEAVTLTGANGANARIMTYGATLQAFNVPDRNGRVADIELGYDTAADYVSHPNFWGQTIGRYANRIAGGRFVLDDKPYQLTLNDHGQSLHGGTQGFDKHIWRITATRQQGGSASVTMTLVSPAGDQGYPGTLTATVTYTFDDHGSLTLDYAATTDAPTVVNMTNHAIFNLGGEGAPGGILRHRMTIPASRYTPVNAALIPTGELKSVAGTVFDFTHGRTIEDGIRDGRDPQIVAGRGYDHNFAIDAGKTQSPKLMVRLEDPVSGRVLEVLSDQPGLQVYSGNFFDSTLVGKGGHVYRMGDGTPWNRSSFPTRPTSLPLARPGLIPATPITIA